MGVNRPSVVDGEPLGDEHGAIHLARDGFMFTKNATRAMLLAVLVMALAGCYYKKTDKHSGASQSISSEEYRQLNK